MGDLAPRSFGDGERFQVRRILGAGGMGVVYEVFDRDLDATVALKTLRHLDADRLFLFKREFRGLVGIAHPNLVALYELFAHGEECFFTMELLRGVGLLPHVRGAAGALAPGDAEKSGHETASISGAPAPRPVRRGSRAPRPLEESLDLARLRDTLRQVALGLGALHEAGRLHCDIKPSNVLCTVEGRAVICDFGLIADLERRGTRLGAAAGAPRLGGTRPVGTAAYMSPEQAAGEPLTPASDWYAVGVMLHEALAGTLPFVGTSDEILEQKRWREPLPIGRLVAGLPRDLEELCDDLLRREAHRRPDGAEVLERLGAGARRAADPAQAIGVSPLFVGREDQLAALRRALLDGGAGRAPLALIRGDAGVGKTTLSRRFLDEVRAAPDALVLEGRCFERESVPFGALDGVVDALSARLLALPPSELGALLPPDAAIAVRLFPVLRRLPPLAAAAQVDPCPDPRELRRRAGVALRELLRRMAERWTVVIHVDDLQWGDADSGDLLAALVGGPEAPPIRFLGCHRGGATASPFLAVLRDPGYAAQLGRIEEIALAPLSPDEAVELAAVLVGGAGEDVRPAATAVARESGGNSLLLHELARLMRAETRQGVQAELGASVSLASLVDWRLRRLSEHARDLLCNVAIAGRPIAVTALLRAQGPGGDVMSALSQLHAEHLVRAPAGRERDEIEAYHDRIREELVMLLSPEERRDRHGRLARALDSTGADPTVLLEHYLAAGERATAAEHARRAAEQAAEALAFERAAELYRLAVDLGASPDAPWELRARLALALANAGRGGDAGEAYLAALPGAPLASALEWRGRAAEQFLRSGRLGDGLTALRDVLAGEGMRLAPTPRRALLSLIARRAWIRLRGLRFRRRAAAELPPETLRRIDVCWSVASGLGLIDVVRAQEFQARHLQLALAAGEPHRIARALAVSGGYASSGGTRNARQSARLFTLAGSLAAECGDSHAAALTAGLSGIGLFLEGRWLDARRRLEHADELLARCPGVALERFAGQLFHLGALFYLGEWHELVRRVPLLLADVEARGDLHASTSLRSWITNAAWLVRDEPHAAREQVEAALRRWPGREFHLQHNYELLSLTQIDLYAGRGVDAWERMTSRWGELRRALLLRVQNVRITAWHLRARAALTVSAATGDRALQRAAARDVRRLDREATPWSRATARVLEGALASQRGAAVDAAAAVRAAADGFAAADMSAYAAVCRLRLGQLLGGAPGDDLSSAAAGALRAQGVVSPERIASMIAPGFALARATGC